MLEIPQRLDRADGDVHAAGNPHIQTDPRNIAIVAEPLVRRLPELDRANTATYQARSADVLARWMVPSSTGKRWWRRYGAPPS